MVEKFTEELLRLCTFHTIIALSRIWDGIPDDWEYLEEEDTYWIPQGWYEVCDYFEDYSYSQITDCVKAWMKLPKPYEPKVKEFGGRDSGK